MKKNRKKVSKFKILKKNDKKNPVKFFLKNPEKFHRKNKKKRYETYFMENLKTTKVFKYFWKF